MEVDLKVKMSSSKVLNKIQLYNYNTMDVPRYIRVNGELLRRGDLHYHRNKKVWNSNLIKIFKNLIFLKMLEMYDLAIPLNSDVHLTLHKGDKAGEQIECAVSYNGNKNFEMRKN